MDPAPSDGDARWEHFPHGADVGIRGLGPTREAAFAQAACALTAVLTDPAKVEARERVKLHCEAPDDELLFVDWLNGLIYEMATRHMLFSAFALEIDDHRLDGEARGEAVDRARHEPAAEVKGATYTELKVERQAGGEWLAQCVVDV